MLFRSRLASRGDEVVGLDNINDYYDPFIKYRRLAFSDEDLLSAGFFEMSTMPSVNRMTWRRPGDATGVVQSWLATLRTASMSVKRPRELIWLVSVRVLVFQSS